MGHGDSTDVPQVSPLVLNGGEAAAAATECRVVVRVSPSRLLTSSHYQIVTLWSRACQPSMLLFVWPTRLYTSAAGEHVSGGCLEGNFCGHTPIATHAEACASTGSGSRHLGEAAACLVLGA